MPAAVVVDYTDSWSYLDEVFVLRARRGDDRAYDLLVRAYRPLVERQARHYFLPGAEIEDVVQEGMLGLIKAIRDFSPDRECPFHRFAELCVRRQIETAVKMSTRKKHGPLNQCTSLYAKVGEAEDLILLDILADPKCPNPEVETLARLLQEDLVEFIRSLSDLERKVLRFYVLAWSYRDIAAAVGRTTKCVDNALQRIMRKLRAFLEG
jgi:RNA polymerase sporulation-specific sigma factor